MRHDEIAGREAGGGEGATVSSVTRCLTPLPATMPGAKRAGRRTKATLGAPASVAAPSSGTPSAAQAADDDGGGEAPRRASPNNRAPLRPVIDKIIVAAQLRRMCIRHLNALDNDAKARLRGAMGFRWDLPKAERDAISKAAAETLKAIDRQFLLATMTPDEAKKGRLKRFPVPERGREWAAHPDILRYLAVLWPKRHGFEADREKVEDELKALAEHLPAIDFVRSVDGFGELGFAVIVGECASSAAPLGIGDYRSHNNFAKRLGYGTVEGRRQGSPPPDAKPADWEAHGYSKDRHGTIYGVLEGPLLRHQLEWRHKKTGAVTKEPGPYGLICRERRQYEETLNVAGAYADQAAEQLARLGKGGKSISKKTRELLEAGQLTPAHLNQRARRYAVKRLLKHLWQAWRRANRSADTTVGPPSADPLPEAAE